MLGCQLTTLVPVSFWAHTTPARPTQLRIALYYVLQSDAGWTELWFCSALLAPDGTPLMVQAAHFSALSLSPPDKFILSDYPLPSLPPSNHIFLEPKTALLICLANRRWKDITATNHAGHGLSQSMRLLSSPPLVPPSG
ncbi:hypothetical protein PAMP_009167 [Pampus punctatissimus]